MLEKAHVRRLRDELGWLGDLLGEVRDLDVLSSHLKRDAEKLVKARIVAKRVRYVAELVAPLRGKPACRLAESAKNYQDVLGENEAAVVAIRELRKLMTISPERRPILAAGRLIEQQDTRKHDARKQAPRAWRKLRRQGKRTW